MSDLPDSASLFGPGKVFAEGREALGLSRAQLADILNLPVRTILAIEENNPSVLPDAVYVNGYMRSYSKLLGLASQPLIDAWWAQHVENQEQGAIETRNDEIAENTVNARPFKMGRWAAAGLFLAVGFVYFVTNSDQQAVTDEAGSQASDSDVSRQEAMLGPAVATVAEPALGVNQQAIPESLSAPETAVPIAPILNTQQNADGRDALTVRERTVVEAAAEPMKVETQVVEAEMDGVEALAALSDDLSTVDAVAQDTFSVSEPEREIPLAFALPRLTEFGDNTIVLAFSADCWFEIRNADGDLLYADLGRGNQTRRYFGDGPFMIKLGFSPGVILTYNGVVVDLDPYTRQDVANVIVGASTGDAQSAPQTNATQVKHATQVALLW